MVPRDPDPDATLSPGRAVVFRARARDDCLEMQVTLQAVGIGSSVVRSSTAWLLVVDEADEHAARHHLDSYRSENFDPPRSQPAPIPLLWGGGPAALTYVAVVVGVALFSHRHLFGADWLAAGRMQAGLVVEGQWWRVFTALTLHVDTAHLLANVVFGAVLGFLAAQALGGGVAWLGILLAGGIGNALNALVQDPRHSAVGASTSVFAALGIMVAHALVYRRRTPGGPARRWSPLIGGVVLLAFTGMGGVRTDVLAHVTGLLSGLLVGAAGSRIPIRALEKHDVQVAAAVAVGMILVVSWAMALS